MHQIDSYESPYFYLAFDVLLLGEVTLSPHRPSNLESLAHISPVSLYTQVPVSRVDSASLSLSSSAFPRF